MQSSAAPTDPLASNALTWTRWEAEPRITAQVLAGYVEILAVERFLGRASEVDRILKRIADLAEGRP